MEKWQLISTIDRLVEQWEHNGWGMALETGYQHIISILEEFLAFTALEETSTVTKSVGEGREKDVILVVSDNSAVRSYLREVLVPGYVVEEAADGAGGFKLAKMLLPDLVISDFALPGMDGTDMCKAIKQDNHTGHIPLILLCSGGAEECIVKGFESGADDCIAGSLKIKILKVRIKNLLDNRRQLKDMLWLRAMVRITATAADSTDSKFLEQLHEIIEENLSNPLFTVEDLCDKLCMSHPSMYRRIRSLTGESPQLFIRSYRLNRAAQLLENNYGNVTEVCFQVGFTSTAYFSKCFKKKFNYSPKEFVSTLNNGSAGSSSSGDGGRELETGGPGNYGFT